MAREVMAEDRRKVHYQLTQKGVELLPAMIALRQWGEKWGAGVPSTPVLVDTHDEQPIGRVTITAHDGRALEYGELVWKHRSELQPLGQSGMRVDERAIGRAHVWNRVPTAQLVWRLVLGNNKTQ